MRTRPKSLTACSEDWPARTVARHERRWSTRIDAIATGHTFARAMADGQATLGTPALSNVWTDHRPFSSCAAVPTAERLDFDPLQTAAEPYYLDNMGSGFNLDPFEDPVGALLDLNSHAAKVEASARCERYVGNMAHLSITHPRLREFIAVKTTNE